MGRGRVWVRVRARGRVLMLTQTSLTLTQHTKRPWKVQWSLPYHSHRLYVSIPIHSHRGGMTAACLN